MPSRQYPDAFRESREHKIAFAMAYSQTLGSRITRPFHEVKIQNYPWLGEPLPTLVNASAEYKASPNHELHQITRIQLAIYPVQRSASPLQIGSQVY